MIFAHMDQLGLVVRRIESDGFLRVERLGRGHCWFDTGTHESLVEAADFVRTVENRQGLRIACLEEIAFQNEWVSADDIVRLAEPLKKSGYGEYLLKLVAK